AAPRFGTAASVREIAATALAAAGAERRAAVADLIWGLLYDERPSLGYHLARCLEAPDGDAGGGGGGGPPPVEVPSALVRGLAVGSHIRGPAGEAVEEMRAAVEQLHDYVAWLPESDGDAREYGSLLL